MAIPKIIHYIAPADRSRWHPIWNRCYPSWQQHFLDFEHKCWDDNNGINNFVSENYPQYYNMYIEFPVHIMRIDFARFCLLHHFGGIYTDLDMFCYFNFYNELTHSLHIVEAPYGEEFLESSLMISEPGHSFWIDCMELSKEVFNTTVKKRGIQIPFNNNLADQHIILATCGPNLICRVWRKWIKTNLDKLKALPGILYNNHGMSYHPEYRTKHLMTGMWGKEAIDYLESQFQVLEGENLDTIYIKEMKRYANLSSINSINDLDFYTDYTNGGMKKYFVPDLDKNNIDTGKFINYG